MVTLSNLNVETLNEFAISSVMVSFAEEILNILRLLLAIIAFVGFGFYLWFLSSSNDQTQKRLLNILNGYLSVACMGLCPLIYVYDYLNIELQLINVRLGTPFVIAITILFLLLSFATILNHFQPDMYLDLSLAWQHKMAVPTIIVFCIIVEQMMNLPCPENFVKCEIEQLRRVFMIPATVTSLFGQLIVIVDVSFGCQNIYEALKGFFRSNSVTPVDEIDPEILVTTAQQPYNPAPGLNHHVVGYKLILKLFLKQNCSRSWSLSPPGS